ncbi:hypothetical protein CHS0354_003061 [Potamilus streckersoni]|uniref:Uncharacterized protein n=1 Tax=Potamilus streckersoni TaxID=2493646 RepID=A0AAE0VUF7_9BIVA|nr:hypothetical protein CHS0354_003061 [Potamilus streckersoni]
MVGSESGVGVRLKEKNKRMVRRPSHHDAVQAIMSCWRCMVLALEQEAAQNDYANAEKANLILTEVHTYKFLASTMLLFDVLEELTRCSKVFQKEVIDIDHLEHMLDATLEALNDHVSNTDVYTPHVTELNGQLDMSGKYHGVQPKEYHQRTKVYVRNLGKELVACVESEMRKRFSPCDMQILKDLSTVMNPRQLPQISEDLKTHGSESSGRLTEQFGMGGKIL